MKRRCRLDGILLSAATILVLAVVGLATEAVVRATWRPGPDGVRRLFHAELSVARWSFLDTRRDALVIESTDPGFGALEERRVGPEADRPPFDRIDAPFTMRTNEVGLRERLLCSPEVEAPLTVFAFGDSVTFGRGVEEKDRYTNRVEAAFGGELAVLNFAFPGCTSECMRLLLDRHIARRPDIVLIQASSNDFDLTAWRQSEGSPFAALTSFALRLAVRSRALMALSFALFDDAWPARAAAAADEAALRYTEDVEAMMRAARDWGARVVVVTLPWATGFTAGWHVPEACRRNQDVCLGVIRVDFDDPGAWVEGLDARVSVARDQADWVSETADVLGLPVDDVAALFPHRRLFFDLAHPNALGNAVVAAQVERFLRERVVGR